MKINYRQLAVISFFMVTASKFLSLPSLIFIDCKNDSWTVYAGIISLDLIVILIALKFIKQNKDETFYEFLKKRIGTFFAKIVCFCFLIVILYDLLDEITGLQGLLLQDFYTELNWYIYLIPLLSLLAFTSYKGIRNIGRLCELLIYPVIFGLVFIILKGLPQFDITYLLPIMSNGVGAIIHTLIKRISWFGTPIVLLFFMGKVDYQDYKRSVYQKFIFYAILIVFLGINVFYGVFKSNSGFHSFAISDLSQVANSSTALDELSWLVVSIWIVGQTLQLVILFYAAMIAFRYVFNVNNSWLPILILNVTIIIYQSINNETVDIEKFVYQTPAIIFGWSVKFGIVLLLLLINFVYNKRRKHGKT